MNINNNIIETMHSAIEHYVNMTLYKCCILLLVERGLLFLPRDGQGWLHVAWVKCVIETSWVGGGGCRKRL